VNDVLPDVDDDFAPVDPVRAAIESLVRGASRRDIAESLDLSLPRVHQVVAQGVREHSGQSGTRREAFALIHIVLDDVVRRTHEALDRDVENTAPLLEVLLGVQRLRAGLLAAGKSDADIDPPESRRATKTTTPVNERENTP
jgi:hypothetical protein